MNWVKRHWLLILILLAALTLRLYRIEATMTFLEDEGRDLLMVKRMFDTGRPVLLGPQTSTGDMYLGPLYYYLIAPALYLSNMDPVGPAIMVALSGVITCALLFYVGKKWFSAIAGYLAALMFGVLPLAVMVTRSSWNPNLVPLTTVAMLVVWDWITTSKAKLAHWLAYGMLIGVMVQLHYMTLIFCGVLSLAIVWSYRHHIRDLLKGMPAALSGVLLLLAPFIVFELRNNWVNTNALINFIKPAEAKIIRYDPPVSLWMDKVGDASYRLISNTLVGSGRGKSITQLAVIIFVLSILLTLYKSPPRRYIAVIGILFGCLMILGVYQENIHLHYLEFGIPLIILAVAGVVHTASSFWHNWLAGALITLVLIGGIPNTIAAITSDPTHQVGKARDVAGYIVARAGGESYNVVSTQGMYTTPFQYFLAISPHPPSNQLAGRVFAICADSPCPADDVTTTLLFLTGPGHPSIASYLGHPQLNSFEGKREMVRNEHVSYGIWVAEMVLE